MLIEGHHLQTPKHAYYKFFFYLLWLMEFLFLLTTITIQSGVTDLFF